jgi:signal transduction histidine kinase
VTTELLRRPLAATLYLVGGSIVATGAVIVFPTLLALGIGLLPVFLVGLPILVLSMESWRLLARLERRRAALALRAPIETPHRAERPAKLLPRWRAMITDRLTWKEALWAALIVPVGYAGATIAVAGWSATLALLATPVAAPLAPDGTWLGDLSPALWVVGLLGGVVAAAVTGAVSVGLAEATALLARALLGPDRRAEIEARAATLETTRAGAVESADQTLRRIERDLHDGAQHRLAYVAMELGRARAKLKDDPDAAAELLDNAFNESKTAMTELRDLVRGIHPSVLADRGLDAAVSGLAGRCPVPVTVTIDLPERPPVATETAAYFVIAEALTNVGKHAGATQASVTVTRDADGLRVVVADDGRGGASVAPGGGLGGLAQRVAALDGTLTVDSPDGQGTTVTAVL